MYVLAQRARWETRRSLAFGAISGTYEAIGSSLLNPCRIIKLINTTDVDIDISTNGIDDHDIVPSGGFTLYDFTANGTEQGGGLFVDQGYTFYAKGTPTEGSVYLVTIYASSK